MSRKRKRELLTGQLDKGKDKLDRWLNMIDSRPEIIIDQIDCHDKRQASFFKDMYRGSTVARIRITQKISLYTINVSKVCTRDKMKMLRSSNFKDTRRDAAC